MRRDRREEVEEGLGSKCVRLATYGSRRARSDGGWLKIDPHHSELNPAAALIPPPPPSLTRIPSPLNVLVFLPGMLSVCPHRLLASSRGRAVKPSGMTSRRRPGAPSVLPDSTTAFPASKGAPLSVLMQRQTGHKRDASGGWRQERR